MYAKRSIFLSLSLSLSLYIYIYIYIPSAGNLFTRTSEKILLCSNEVKTSKME